MRQANRIFGISEENLTKADLTTLRAEDILGSRLFIAAMDDIYSR